jgi:hypothetical protein
MARTSKASTREVLVVHEGGAQVEEENPTKGLPLFAGEEGITGISVYRLEPIEEGTIATVPPESDDDAIRRRFGGGVFRMTAKGVDGKIKGTRTITIGGDPKFESLDAKKRYRNKLAGLDELGPTTPPPPPLPPSMAVPEILALVTQSHGQQMEMMRMQMQAQQVVADDRERRARIEADERETRARREAEESRERDRAFNATMLTMVKNDSKAAASSPLEMISVLMQGLKLGRQMSAGAEETPADPLTMFMQNLPGILEHGRGLVQAGTEAAAGQPRINPAPAVAGKPGGIRLTGPVATRLQQMVEGLKGKGYDEATSWSLAEQALALGVDQLAQVPNAPTQPDPPPPPPSSAPPRLVRKATTRSSRATPRR